MRSEGFPFIVGVWGWTRVRVVLVVSSSCRRRCVINFSPLGGTHALRRVVGGSPWVDMPCLFKSDGQSQWASEPAELLATMVGLKAFGYLDKEAGYDLVPVVLRAGTDNRANEALMMKASRCRTKNRHVHRQEEMAARRLHMRSTEFHRFHVSLSLDLLDAGISYW